MAKGNDEAHNPNRRPKRPGEQTEDEKIEIVKQVFPNAEVIDDDYNPYDSLEDELKYMDETGIDPMTGQPLD